MMRIAALFLQANNGWPELGTDALAPGLNVFFGPSASGKTTLADLVTHALYGRRLLADSSAAESLAAPCGEVMVDNRGRQFRLRRSHDAQARERLTVAALDHSAVDQETVGQLVAALSPLVLQSLFAATFRETPRLESLLSAEFSQEFRAGLWRLKWAPPTVEAPLRPIYARLRALELKVTKLSRGLEPRDELSAADAKNRARARKRRASYYLGQLTGGELVRLDLGKTSGLAQVVTRAGEFHPVDALWSTQQDQVYLSLVLALISALARQRARLPFVLDEPFYRMDAKSAAALVHVLDAFTRRGNQALVFTSNREAAERAAAVGAKVHEMPSPIGREILATPPDTADAAEVATRRLRRRAKASRMKHREAG